jgi:hypothetical protein
MIHQPRRTCDFGFAGLLLFAGILSGGQACVTRTVPVNIVDKSEDLVNGLNAADFRIELNGKRLAVIAAEYDRSQRRCVVLIDTSSSIVQERNLWTAAVTLAKQFTEIAPPTLSLALFTFSRKVESRTAFVESRDPLRRTLRHLETAGPQLKHPRRTAILDGLLETVSDLRPQRFGDSIVLITDGDENAREHDEAQLTAALLRSGVRLFAFVIDTRMSRNPIRQETYEWLSRVAITSGGDLSPLFPRQQSLMELQNTLRKITEVYRLDVDVCEHMTKVMRWKILAAESDSHSVIRGKQFRLKYPTATVPVRPR